ESHRRLESSNQVCYALESHLYVWILRDVFIAFFRRSWNKGELLGWLIAAIRIPTNVITLDFTEHMSEILGVWTVKRLDIPQLQRLPRLLHEVQEFVNLQERHKRVHQSV